jgi:formylmethanofuran dehydrogenase subunit E
MTCTYPKQTIEDTIAFHGHTCPGLAIGIRVAECVTKEFPDTPLGALVCIAETDMCGVDAIQYLIGCTYGKGNLIHRDYGKTAFSFYDRENSKGIRLLLKPNCHGENFGELADMMEEESAGSLSKEGSQKLAELRILLENRFMSLSLEDMFFIKKLQTRPPRSARVLHSMTCEDCGEQTMESRTRRFNKKTLCIPCFRKVEQKI